MQPSESRGERPIRKKEEMLRAIVLISGLLGFVTLNGCGGPSTTSQDPSASPGDVPELTSEVIRERINGARVGEIPDESGTGQKISWRFFGEEPKEITVVEKKVEGPSATVVLDVTTQSGPRAREPRHLAGQIRTEWKLTAGWVLRQWEIVGTENISMKYRNLPVPSSQNSNR
jgi:hypothetical protein